MARITLDNVSLQFRVRKQDKLGLKDYLVKWMFLEKRNPFMEVRALEGVSLEVRRGERVGILGHNGAGKSTMLKVLAGIYPPTTGTRIVEGRISSLFDITLGFEPEASGWENIKFRSYLQGETPATLKGHVQEIAEFSELGDFLDMPVRYYSAGMMVRLAFSISTAIEPEILLIDEALGAGDLNFQQKARTRMREMMSKAQLIVMVSHDLNALADFCDRLIWMDHGQVRQVGPPDEIIPAYKKSVQRAPAKAA
jgi:ABC-type polysaccharide/polyol phosphate transport system ATPase subunit